MDIKCTYCRSKLDKTWNYCPKCGTQVDRRISMFGLLKRQMDILRNLLTRDDDYQPRVQTSRNTIAIRIDSRGFGEPTIHVFPKLVSAGEEPYQDRIQTERKLTGKIIEPKVDVKRLAKEMIITIPLPDVKSEGDVELNRLTDSVELRAFAGDKGYFKILNIPKSHKLVEKTLSDGRLSLKFSI